MLTQFPGMTAVLALIAVAPAIARWWHGRTLQRLADDPALPERLLAARQVTSGVGRLCDDVLRIPQDTPSRVR